MVSLSKKQTVSLTKMAQGLSTVMFGLGWDAVEKKKGFFSSILGGGSDANIDLDASCICLDARGHIIDSVWFGDLTSDCLSIRHSGDNRTGDGDGDDETIFTNLNQLPEQIEHLVLTVNSYEGQTFNEVKNAYCRVVDNATNKELARFTLSDRGSHTGIIVASLKRSNGQWEFTAQGLPASGRTVNDLVPQAKAAIGL